MSVNLLAGANVGIEIECAGMNEVTATTLVRNSKALRGLKVTHDGSIVRKVTYVKGISNPFAEVNAPREFRNEFCGTGDAGIELVSGIMDATDPSFRDQIRDMFNVLRDSGEVSDRLCAFHVHVNCSQLPFFILQNILKIWQRVEATMFRLSVGTLAEGVMRGNLRQNNLYCRPLHSPQVVIDANTNEFRPVYDVNKMLLAKNMKDFFLAYGGTNYLKDPGKYHPARYSGVGLHSYVRQGTVEFRVSNTSFDWEHVYAWIETYRAIVNGAMGKVPLDFPLQSLGSKADFNPDNLQFMLGLDDAIMPALWNLFNSTSWQIFNPIPQMTHVAEQRKFDFSGIPVKFIPDALPKGTKVRWYTEKYGDKYIETNDINDIRG